MTFAEAIAFAILQGISELFPISSLGHAVVVPALIAPGIDLRSPAFLPFLVVLHLGTAIALLAYFWRDWRDLLIGVFAGGKDHEGEDRRRLLSLLVVATIPAVIIGAAFRETLGRLFADPKAAAMFLIANGFLLALGEVLRQRAVARQNPTGAAGKMSFLAAIAVGLWQCLAFFPGISRSGATIVGGLLAKLTHEQAARFSFLMATPIIFGASAHEIPKLLRGAPAGAAAMPLSTIVTSGVAAGVAAFLSVAFLMHYFRRHEFAALLPFAVYCVFFGTAALVLLS